MPPDVVLVEDDYIQEESIEEGLRSGLPDVNLTVLRTESEFRLWLEATPSPPDLIVMDVMLRWTDPSPDMVAPPADVQQGVVYQAGLRSAKLLAASHLTANVPVILYTVLEHTDLSTELRGLPRTVRYLRKESRLDSLIRRIRDLTS